jgi:hypothetical protein
MIYYIFAANYQHAIYCAKQNGLYLSNVTRNVHYINHEEQLLGISKNENIEFIFFVTFRQHPRYPQISERVRILEHISDSKMPIYREEEHKMEEPTDTFWWKLVHLDPTLIRGLVMATILLLSSIGILVSPEVPNSLIGFIATVLAIVQALWTRPAVTPNAKVAVVVPDPVNAPEVVEAGNATTTATTKDIIEAARASGGSNEN